MTVQFMEYKRDINEEMHKHLNEGNYDASNLIELQATLISIIKTIQMEKYLLKSLTTDESTTLIISIELFSNRISWSLLHNSYKDYDWYEEWGKIIGHYTELFIEGGE